MEFREGDCFCDLSWSLRPTLFRWSRVKSKITEYCGNRSRLPEVPRVSDVLKISDFFSFAPDSSMHPHFRIIFSGGNRRNSINNFLRDWKLIYCEYQIIVVDVGGWFHRTALEPSNGSFNVSNLRWDYRIYGLWSNNDDFRGLVFIYCLEGSPLHSAQNMACECWREAILIEAHRHE